MKRFILFILLGLLISAPALADYCIKCGAELQDNANFCFKCGKRQVPLKAKKETEKISKPKKKIINLKNKFKAKTDIFLYEKRGDEKNVLKKNFLFKARRYRMRRNSYFKILEKVGDSYLVQSFPNKDGHTMQGWVYENQLEMRSNWKKLE